VNWWCVVVVVGLGKCVECIKLCHREKGSIIMALVLALPLEDPLLFMVLTLLLTPNP
jgi:hypothetical protein